MFCRIRSQTKCAIGSSRGSDRDRAYASPTQGQDTSTLKFSLLTFPSIVVAFSITPLKLELSIRLNTGCQHGIRVHHRRAPTVRPAPQRFPFHSRFLSDFRPQTVPLTRLCRCGRRAGGLAAAPVCAVDLGGTLNKVICVSDPAKARQCGS